MKYYKVVVSDILDRKSGYVTIENELLTEKERNKRFSTVSDNAFKPVQISKRNIYFYFGARFQL